MKNQKPDGAIQQLASTLRKRFGTHLVKIILFGSRARGDYEPDSDYDVLVLLDEVTKEIRDEIDEIVWQIGWDNDVLITSIVHDVRTFETHLYEPLFINVRKEGITL
ncbi:MAG: nucleotidyltransferase domain-containing protein [Candidatus Brocadiaceae bacterium]|nr:nucleotidyltransferase domain-containing protein [Candidatus Brocadiaceae bacterium]